MSQEPKLPTRRPCLFCSSRITDENYSDDHVFPQLIGGWFTVDFICKPCNDKFGSSFDSDLRKNAYVHAACQALGLGSDYLKGQKITFSAPTGHKGKMGVPKGRDKPVVITSKQDDGSFVADDQIALRSLTAYLREHDWSDEEIQEYCVKVHENAPTGVFVPIAKPGGPIVHWIRKCQDNLTIEYDDLQLPIRFALIAKIALELWVAFGFGIHSKFNPAEVIGAIKLNDPSKLTALRPAFGVNVSIYDLPYKKFHYCNFGVISAVAVAQVCLFGILNFAVALGEVPASSGGDWLSHAWIFPISDNPDERMLSPHVPHELDIARMKSASLAYLGRKG